MRINKVARNKVEVVEGGKKVEIEVSRIGKHYVVAVSDGENVVDLTLKDVVSAKLINTLRRFGVSDVDRVLSYLASMSSVKKIEAQSAIFMKVEDVVRVETGEVVDRVVETFFHTAEGDWRVFTPDGVLREVYNVTAPIRNVTKLFYHYNAPNVEKDSVTGLCAAAKEVREVLSQYVVLEEKYLDVAATWITATYLRWAAQYSELLIIRKLGFGSGGSTLLKTAVLLSARPLQIVVNTSPAAFYRVVDFAMPTVGLDEIREDEIEKNRLAELKLLAESSFETHNVVLRVEEGEVEAFKTFANVAVVDTTDRFTTYSAERRAWTVAIRQAHPPRFFDAQEILDATVSLRERLYAIGIALPTVYLPQWRTLVKEQGLGVLKFLERASRHLCGDTEIFESALRTVEQQLTYARETALLTDPKRLVAETLLRIIRDAKRELEMAASSPHNASEYVSIVAPEDPEYRCGVVYLQKLIRELRRRSMEVVQVDTTKLDSVHYTTEQVRFWFRINEDVKMYLKPAKIKAILAELGVSLEVDESRNYFIRICR
jgi:hypothetical protein